MRQAQVSGIKLHQILVSWQSKSRLLNSLRNLDDERHLWGGKWTAAFPGFEPQPFCCVSFMLPISPKWWGGISAKKNAYLHQWKKQNCTTLGQMSPDVRKAAKINQCTSWPAPWWVRHSWRPLLMFVLANDIRYERPNWSPTKKLAIVFILIHIFSVFMQLVGHLVCSFKL